LALRSNKKNILVTNPVTNSELCRVGFAEADIKMAVIAHVVALMMLSRCSAFSMPMTAAVRRSHCSAFSMPMMTAVRRSHSALYAHGDPAAPTMKAVIVRHGETHANRAGILQGQSDTELNDLGVAQADAVAQALAGTTWSAVYSSDLRRCARTAATIAAQAGAGTPELTYDTRLREIALGARQGRPVTMSAKEALAEATAAGEDVPLLESRAELAARLRAWVVDTTRAQSALGAAAPPALVVSHGGAISCLLDVCGAAMGNCVNCSITDLEVSLGDGDAIVATLGPRVNEAEHMKDCDGMAKGGDDASAAIASVLG